LVSEDAPPGFPESWKGGYSSRDPTTHSSVTTVMDYTFKINVLAWELERGVLPPSTMTTTMTMAASTSPALTPTVGLLRRRLPLLN
jgi:hypothetical protein